MTIAHQPAVFILVTALASLAHAGQPADSRPHPAAVSMPEWPSRSIVAAPPYEGGTSQPPRAEAAVAPQPSLAAEATAAHGDDGHAARRLSPRSGAAEGSSRRGASEGAAEMISRLGLRFESIYSTCAALAFVLGLFLLCMWGLRRGSRKTAKSLPAAAVSVLGRVAIAPKQFAELLRVGNKLVLVAITHEGPKPLAEITDPAEVERIVGLCQQADTHSATQDFDRVFRELASEPASKAFLETEVPVISVSKTKSASHRAAGGFGRA